MRPREIKFFEESFNCILDVDKKLVDLRRIAPIAEKNGFKEKEEFHITLIGNKAGRKIVSAINELEPEKRVKIAENIEDLIFKNKWDFELEPEILRIKKALKLDGADETVLPHDNFKETYIQAVRMPSIRRFYNDLNEMLNIDLPVQPAHITLYTKSSGPGANQSIAVNSREELEKLNPKRVM